MTAEQEKISDDTKEAQPPKEPKEPKEPNEATAETAETAETADPAYHVDFSDPPDLSDLEDIAGRRETEAHTSFGNDLLEVVGLVAALGTIMTYAIRIFQKII